MKLFLEFIVLLLLIQFTTANVLAIYDGSNLEPDEDDESTNEAETADEMPLESPPERRQLKKRGGKSLSDFIDEEKGWMTVFVKHLALHQKWALQIGGLAVNAHLYGMFASVLFRILKDANDKSGGVFNQIRAQLDKRISYHINKNKIYHAHKIFDNQVAKIAAKMHWRCGKANTCYRYEDLLDLRSFLPDFLPTEPSADFDEEWFPLMAGYLILYKNFYNGLINDGKMNKCVFVKDWDTHLKEALQKSIRRLSYSYFSRLQKTGRGKRLVGRAWLMYEDRIPETTKEYWGYFTTVQTEVFDKLSDHVADIMMKNIGNSYNALLTDFTKAELEECGGVTLLTTEDLRTEYPKSCYGKAESDGQVIQCDLPCGKYSESSAYCIYFHGREPEDTEIKAVRWNNRVDTCQGDGPEYWRTCTHIEKSPDIASWDKSMAELQEEYQKKKTKAAN